MQWIALTMLVSLLASPLPLRAEDCLYRDGGYCLDQLVEKTLKIMEESKSEKAERILKSREREKLGKYEGMVLTASTLRGGIYFYINYDVMWNGFVGSGLVSEQEKKTAFEEAAQAGGTKIGGVNLVVLAARTLQKLVDLKILTLEEAQGILDQSRRGL